MKRVLVIEDNANLAAGLAANLEIEGYAVLVAADGPAGLARAKDWNPDLVVLDLMLPGLDGYRVLREMRAGALRMPVLLLTARGEEADKVKGLKLGADDYVTKPFGLLELLARVEALLRRAAPATPAAPIRLGEVEVHLAARRVTLAGQPVELSPKEFDLLAALLKRRGRAVSRDELLAQVWGYDSGVVSRTVDTHMAVLRRKLEADPAEPRHFITVRKTGYLLE